MTEINPIKLVDLGGGAGELREFAAGDTLPASALPAGVFATASQGDKADTAVQPATLESALAAKVDKATGQSLITDAERTKLNGVAAGAQVNVAANLGQGTRTATGLPLTSSTGAGTTLPVATTTLAGLQSAADKSKLDGIESQATRTVIDDASSGAGTVWSSQKTSNELAGKLGSTATAATATKLTTARTIGGVSFDGTANIDLPGVNVAGTQATTGNAATASGIALGSPANNIDTQFTNGYVQKIEASTPGTFSAFQVKDGTMAVYSDGTNHVQFFNTTQGFTWRRFKGGAANWTPVVKMLDSTQKGLMNTVSFNGSGAITFLHNGGFHNVERLSTGRYSVNGVFGNITNNGAFVAMAMDQRCVIDPNSGGNQRLISTFGYNNTTPTDSAYVCVVGDS